MSITPVTVMEQAWPLMRWPVGAAYLWWGVSWLLVAHYYLGAGKRQWQAIRPDSRNRTAVGVWVHGILMMALAGLVRLRQGKFGQSYAKEELTHTLSMTLQQGIVCSAMCSAIWGISLFTLDRSDYTFGRFALNTFCIVLSSVGAMIHLYPPLRQRHIVAWRVAMLVTWLVLPLLEMTSYAVYALR